MKIKFLLNNQLDYKLLESSFKKSSAKGYHLASMNTLICKYNKSVPEDINYKVILRGALVLSEERLISHAQSSGWNLCAMDSRVLVFSSKTEKEIPEINKFEGSPKAQFDSILKKDVISSMLLFLVLLPVSLHLLLQNSPFNYIYSNGALLDFSTRAIVVIILLVNIFVFTHWYISNKYLLKKYNRVNFNNRIRLMVTHISYVLLFLNIFFFGTLYLFEIKTSNIIMSIRVIILLLVLGATVILGFFTKRSTKTFGNLRNGIIIACVFLLAIPFSFLIPKLYIYRDGVPKSALEDKLVLSRNDIDSSYINYTPRYKHLEENWSILVSQYYEYGETVFLEGNRYSLETVKITPKFKYLSDKFYKNTFGVFSENDISIPSTVKLERGCVILSSSPEIIVQDHNDVYIFKCNSSISIESLKEIVLEKFTKKEALL